MLEPNSHQYGAPNDLSELERTAQKKALDKWAESCEGDFAKKFPELDFHAEFWPIQGTSGIRGKNVNLAPLKKHFKGQHESFFLAGKCLLFGIMESDNLLSLNRFDTGFRLLSKAKIDAIFDIRITHLRVIEASLTKAAKAKPSTAGTTRHKLDLLKRFTEELAKHGVIPRLHWEISLESKRLLRDTSIAHRNSVREQKFNTLDSQIAAFSDAMNASFNKDNRLSQFDHAAIAVIGLEMCAPSRINEVLCLSVNDRVSLSDYVNRPEHKAMDKLHTAHQLLLTMKGSKGADWGAKPVLNFMIDLFNHCISILEELGKRGRMLAKWYEENPSKLYLPAELEYLRYQDIDQRRLWKITTLTDREVLSSEGGLSHPAWDSLKAAGKIKTIDNPRTLNSKGLKSSRTTVTAASWSDVEFELLERVHKAMADVRSVTLHNHYKGRVSNMLMLIDRDSRAYLPQSIKYSALANRFLTTEAHRNWHKENRKGELEPTIFEKLNITIPVNGREEIAFLNTHDPRRWLTTQAMEAKERLSDALINKWANRLSIEHLKHYDFRKKELKAEQASMPDIDVLTDMSNGLAKKRGREDTMGLATEIITVHDAGISVTSMDAVLSATEKRPVARTANQLIILYPTPFGVCTHQHQERPCRAYDGCLPCNENHAVKGHLPSNDAIRQLEAKRLKSIIAQLERLVTAHNREIADSQDGLENHILTLVRSGVSIPEYAETLVNRFHEIKNSIESVQFRNKLEEAFVARGIRERIDDPTVPSGALIKYHNPTRHSAPGHERATDAHGGRNALLNQLAHFESEFPQFAPKLGQVASDAPAYDRDGTEEDWDDED